MIEFLDGPAAREVLMLKRAPVLLRAARGSVTLTPHPSPTQETTNAIVEER